MVTNKLIIGVAAVSFLAGCGASEARPTTGQLSLRIQNNSPNRIYEQGFTCFVGMMDDAGTISIPLRYAMTPRRGFMDAVHLEKRVQNPEFFAEDGMVFSYEGIPLPRFIVVGHRKANAFNPSGPWTLVKLDIAAVPKDPDGIRVLNAEHFKTAATGTPAEVELATQALKVAKKQAAEISGKEP
jgi:hypothetical protein